MNSVIELKFAKFTAVGLFAITCLVVAGPLTDPVNAPKLLLLGALGFGLIPYLILNRASILKTNNRVNLFFVVLFLLVSILTVILSNSPIEQNLYGTFGRNTGFITNFCFLLIYFSISSYREKISHQYIVLALAFSGLINVVYGLIADLFGDPIPWINNYGGLLGTFGNPNFSGAFYGFVSAVFLAYAIDNRNKLIWLGVHFSLFVSSLYCVLKTNATQGILVAAVSNFIVLFFFLHKIIRRKLFTITYLLAGCVSAILIVLGILQKGPLKDYLYKQTVSLRGSYWNAAFETGLQHLFRGVGFDAFGDWYRRARSEKAATWLPGPDVVVNAAHNYYLDIFASGGILLLISYAAFTILGFIGVLKISRKIESFDLISVVLIATFFGFQAQAIVSISQIGVGIWGWAISGALISYARILEIDNSNIKTKKINNKLSDLPVGVFIFSAMSIGILVAVPPYSADAKWRSALNSRDLQKIEAALTPSYFNPQSSFRYGEAIMLLEQSKLFPESLKYARIAVKFNPELYESWRALYFVSNSSAAEKKVALEKMRQLDPRNNKLKELK